MSVRVAAMLVGDAVLVRVLRTVDGMRWVRATAAVALVAFPFLLLLPGYLPKLAALVALSIATAGWYAIPQARLYAACGERSASVLTVGNIAGLPMYFVPVLFGAAADRIGLGATMWFLLAGPLTLLCVLRPHARR